MMNVLLLGDCHGSVSIANRYGKYLKHKFDINLDYVLQFGDYGMFDGVGVHYPIMWPELKAGEIKLKVPHYVIHGNHEDPKEMRLMWSNKVEIPNFHLLGIQEIFELEAGGESIRIMAVGGAPCVDKPSVFTPFYAEDFTDAIVEWEEAGRPPIDILMTHEAPTRTGRIGNPWFGDPERCGIPELRTLWETVKPRWQINGHYHLLHRHYEEAPDGTMLRHMILPEAHDGAVLLTINKGEWSFTDVTYNYSMRK